MIHGIACHFWYYVWISMTATCCCCCFARVFTVSRKSLFTCIASLHFKSALHPAIESVLALPKIFGSIERTERSALWNSLSENSFNNRPAHVCAQESECTYRFYCRSETVNPISRTSDTKSIEERQRYGSRTGREVRRNGV